MSTKKCPYILLHDPDSAAVRQKAKAIAMKGNNPTTQTFKFLAPTAPTIPPRHAAKASRSLTNYINTIKIRRLYLPSNNHKANSNTRTRIATTAVSS